MTVDPFNADPQEKTFRKGLQRLGNPQGYGDRRESTFSRLTHEWRAMLTPEPTLVWDASIQSVVWKSLPRAPDYWTSAQAADHLMHELQMSRHAKLVKSGRNPKPISPSPPNQTALGMAYSALLSGVLDKEETKSCERFIDFLLSAGVDPSFYGGQPSVIALMAQAGDMERLEALYLRGQDLEVRTTPGVAVREAFQGSTLLHRVGPALMAKAASDERSAKDPSIRGRYHACLLSLFKWVPDPTTENAHGQSPLAVLEALLPGQRSETFLAELRQLVVERRAQALGMGLGLIPGDPQHEAWVNRCHAWLLSGQEDSPRPSVFAGVKTKPPVWVELPGQSGPYPRAFRRLEEGERTPGRAVLRVVNPLVVNEGAVQGPQDALRQACGVQADAVVEGDPGQPGAICWAMMRHQVRPYMAFEPVLKPTVSRAPRF